MTYLTEARCPPVRKIFRTIIP